VAAMVAGSDAMMADSAAMMIDAMTYFCNSLAERQKGNYRTSLRQLQQKQKQLQQQQQQRKRQRQQHHQNQQQKQANHLSTLPKRLETQKQQWSDRLSTTLDDDHMRATEMKAFTSQHYHTQQQQHLNAKEGDEDKDEETTQMQIQAYQYHMRMLQMELIPPLISVSALLVVTIVVANKTIHELSWELDLDNNNNGNKNHATAADPNLQLMMLFSVLNLGLDGLNVFCFAKADHAMGYSTRASSPPTMTKNSEDGWTPHARDDGHRHSKAWNKQQGRDMPLYSGSKGYSSFTPDKSRGTMIPVDRKGTMESSSALGDEINKAENPTQKHSWASRIDEQSPPSESPRPPPPPTTALAAQHVTNASDEAFRATTMNTTRNDIHGKNSRDIIINATSPRKTMTPLEIEDVQYSNYPDDSISRAEDVKHDHGSNLNMCSAYTVRFFTVVC
jgi:hypothetical protein